MFQGTFHLHVLGASAFQRAASPQLQKKSSENVIATQTRVRGLFFFSCWQELSSQSDGVDRKRQAILPPTIKSP
jgi:hypothetical protein